MSTTIDATYDGQVFRPAGAVLLEPNTSVRLTIEALAAGAAKDYPEADFYKPVEYNWTNLAYEVDQALMSYGGRTHADR